MGEVCSYTGPAKMGVTHYLSERVVTLSPSSNTPVENVNALEKRKKSKAPPKRPNKNPKQPIPDSKELLKCCKHCGKSHIKQCTKCPAFGKICSACKKPNHFAEMCKSSPGRNSLPRNGVNLVDPDYSSQEELLSVVFDTTEGL